MTMRQIRWALSFVSLFGAMTMVYQLKMQTHIFPTKIPDNLLTAESGTLNEAFAQTKTQQNSSPRAFSTFMNTTTKVTDPPDGQVPGSSDSQSFQNDHSTDSLDEEALKTLPTSRCQESASSNYTTTSYKHHSKLSDILEGPALHVNNLSAAVCEFQHIQYSSHFPHAMQQLYRCWSWWRANSHLPAVLLWHNEKNHGKSSPFLKGFKAFLRHGMNVAIARNHTEAVVRTKLVDGFPQAFALMGSEDAHALTERVLSYSGMNYTPPVCRTDEKACPRIAILNRKLKRELLNAQEITDAIRAILGANCSITITDFETTPFLGQVQFFAETDLVVSPHGAQLTGIPFLPRCGSVLELFPAGFFLPHYFGSLAASSRIHHGYMYLGTNLAAEQAAAEQSVAWRRKIRSRPICPPISKIVNGILQMVDTWRRCCTR